MRWNNVDLFEALGRQLWGGTNRYASMRDASERSGVIEWPRRCVGTGQDAHWDGKGSEHPGLDRGSAFLVVPNHPVPDRQQALGLGALTDG